MVQSSKIKIFESLKDAKDFFKKGSAIAIGNYDGVHHGHQSILNKLIQKAKAKNIKSALLTFDPHPVKVLAPDVAPKLILTREQKIELLSHTSLDAIIFQKFDKDFAKTKPEDFFQNSLIKTLKVQYLTVGYDFTFGKKRTGTIETLEVLAHQHKILLEIIDAKMLDNTLVSSSVIRKMISEGNIPLANKMLTRTYFMDGLVIHGHQRGTALGIHTANLKTENELIPQDGVYATLIKVGSKVYQSVTNIGFNPTFDNLERSIETHIFHFDSDIYDKNVRLYFVKKIRDEIKFATPAALVMQIEKDISETKEILKHKKEP